MKRSHVILMVVIAVALLLSLLAFLYRQNLIAHFFSPTEDATTEQVQSDDLTVEVMTEDLEVPWSVAVLPDGDVLVTERSGRVQRIGAMPFTHEVSDVTARGEGGLLGLALDPDFTENQTVYVYKTTANDNRVERYTVTDSGLSGGEVVFDGIPRSGNHNGGRIAFGPDGMLYIATGDAGDDELAQDVDSLAGKILRVTKEGDIPGGNPFDSAIYSYGHRNVQGLAWDDDDQLWATEHGRSGAATGLDELNRIEAGGNYGWPVVQGDETWADMIPPVLHSGPTTTWAPGSLAYDNGTFYFGGLRGRSLYAVPRQGSDVGALRAYFSNEYGRIRDVTVHDDWLYFTTSNRDGRGTVQTGDDKLVRVPLSQMTTD